MSRSRHRGRASAASGQQPQGLVRLEGGPQQHEARRPAAVRPGSTRGGTGASSGDRRRPRPPTVTTSTHEASSSVECERPTVVSTMVHTVPESGPRSLATDQNRSHCARPETNPGAFSAAQVARPAPAAGSTGRRRAACRAAVRPAGTPPAAAPATPRPPYRRRRARRRRRAAARPGQQRERDGADGQQVPGRQSGQHEERRQREAGGVPRATAVHPAQGQGREQRERRQPERVDARRRSPARGVRRGRGEQRRLATAERPPTAGEPASTWVTRAAA